MEFKNIFFMEFKNTFTVGVDFQKLRAGSGHKN